MTLIEETRMCIADAAKLSNSAILFYSGGKDSVCLLDLIYPYFKRIYLVYMYLVNDLEHITKYLRYAQNKYPNVIIVRIPHFTLAVNLKYGTFTSKKIKVAKQTLSSTDKYVRKQLGCPISFYGMKMSDSLARRLFLGTYENKMICRATNKYYPLSKWKQKDVLSYIKNHKLPPTINYGQGRGSGMMLDVKSLLWMRENYPQDLEKIYKTFPLMRNVLIKYDYEQRNKTEQDGGSKA